MAGKSIKGITIEIAGDSSKLVKALDTAQSSVNAVWKNLKQVNQALKLDPGNVDALAKKQDLLSKAIEATTERLNAEKAAAEAAKNALELGEISQSEYDQFEAQILKTEASLKNLEKQAGETSEALSSVGSGDGGSASVSIQDIHDKTELLTAALGTVEKAGDLAGAALSKGFNMAADAASLALNGVEKVAQASIKVVEDTGRLSYNLSRQVVEAYGEYEQLTGGVDKIFGSAADTVIRNAERAYRTAGVSANRYMQTITGFSASLLQGLNGDTAEAARLADQALQDMSDNANTYGSDLESIMTVYQGLAKGTYTTLDNLRLGYGGTKTEMIRLINDSGILGERIQSLDNITFDQMIEAIHAVQTQMNITGTTARESERTIEGSINSLKASYENFITGLGREDADPAQLAQNLAESFNTVVHNIKPTLERMSTQMPGLLSSMIGSVEDEIPDAVRVAGLVINAVGREIADSAPEVLDILIENLPEGSEIVAQLLGTFSTALSDNSDKIIAAADVIAPSVVQIGANIISVLVQSILDNREDISNALVDAFAPALDDIFGEGTADKVREGIQKIFDSAPEIVEDVLVPLIDITGTLLEQLPEIADVVMPLLSFAAEHLPVIIGLLATLNGAGHLAGIATSVIQISGAISSLSGTAGILEGVGTAAAGAGTSLSAMAATAGPIALLAGEIVALGVEVHEYIGLMGEAEEAGISWTEATIGGVLQTIDTMTPLGQLIGTDFAGSFYEAQRAADDSFQTIDQQAQQVTADIQLAIEQSGAAATQSVADDCAVIQSYLDNLEANGQIELHARVVTEYQTVMSQNLVNSSQAEMAARYAREGRRNTPEARAVTAYGQEMASRYRQQGEEALRAVEETARIAQQAITTDYPRTSGGGGGGGGGGGSSKSNEETPKSSKLQEIAESIDSHLSEILRYLGILNEPTEYQNNVNQMIDGLLKALETGYTDENIETAMQTIADTMNAFGMSSDVIDAATLEQLRQLVNSTPEANTEALTQVQGSVAAIQAATVDYTPHFLSLESILSQILFIKQNEDHTTNVYIGTELISTEIQRLNSEQNLVSGGV